MYEQMRIGDVIAFSGKGFISNAIKVFTLSSITHVGAVIGPNQIIESTTLNGKNGVQLNNISERVAKYHGKVWWYPLLPAISIDVQKFRTFMLEQVGKPYDKRVLLHHAWDVMNWFGWKEHYDKWICSALVAEGLEKGGAISDVNCEEITPKVLVKIPIYGEPVLLS
jgi:hypothetical protein